MTANSPGMPPHYGKAVPQNELFKRNRNLSGMNSINDNAQSGAGTGNRLLVASGIFVRGIGTGWMLPLLIGCLAGGRLFPQGYVALAVGLVLTIGGAVIVCCSVFRRRVETAAVQAPIRAVMAANIVFLAFCVHWKPAMGSFIVAAESSIGLRFSSCLPWPYSTDTFWRTAGLGGLHDCWLASPHFGS